MQFLLKKCNTSILCFLFLFSFETFDGRLFALSGNAYWLSLRNWCFIRFEKKWSEDFQVLREVNSLILTESGRINKQILTVYLELKSFSFWKYADDTEKYVFEILWDWEIFRFAKSCGLNLWSIYCHLKYINEQGHGYWYFFRAEGGNFRNFLTS